MRRSTPLLILAAALVSGCAHPRVHVVVPATHLISPTDETSDIQREANMADYLGEKEADCKDLMETRSDLTERYLNPALDLIHQLQFMTITDPGFGDKVDDLHSLMNEIYRLEDMDQGM